jgi:hypothetical protein
MTTAVENYGEGRRSGGLFWFWAPIVLILFVGGALSVTAYIVEPGLSISESLAAGYGGLAAIIVGIFAAIFGVVLGLLGALFGVVVAGGAVAMTLFVVASPILALILLILLLRRPKSGGAECPDPAAH